MMFSLSRLRPLRRLFALAGCAAALAACSDDDVVVPSSGSIDGHQFVDLNLSVKWATANVGASKAELPGSFFAWGETSPKESYNWASYSLANGSLNSISRYVRTPDSDEAIVLEPADDAARANWGNSWRMPSRDEWIELSANCQWTFKTINGHCGYKVTAINGNWIFLPFAGYRYDADIFVRNGAGYYWTSHLYDSQADAESNLATAGYVFSNSRELKGISRVWGASVRPVCE